MGPFTLPIIAQANGVIIFQDLEEGISTRQIVDDSTGLSSNIVIDWKQQAKNQDLLPRLEIHNKPKDGEVLVLENGSPASYELPVDAIIGVVNAKKIKEGDVIARVPKESSKTKDITGGLPRVAELFEARKPKDHSVIAEISGKIVFGKDYKAKRKISIVSMMHQLNLLNMLFQKLNTYLFKREIMLKLVILLSMVVLFLTIY